VLSSFTSIPFYTCKNIISLSQMIILLFGSTFFKGGFGSNPNNSVLSSFTSIKYDTCKNKSIVKTKTGSSKKN
jgi:hypothetical protein